MTEHFSFGEFVKTSHKELQAENTEQGHKFIDNMRALANELEKLRLFVFRPVFVTSGFRCLLLNMHVCGALGSQHLTGSAVDFTVKDFQDVRGLSTIFSWCGDHLNYGQLILECPIGRKPWIHLGLPRPDRKPSRMIFDGKEYRDV